MRRIAIIVLVGLALMAPDAFAVGLALNWDKCLDTYHSYVGDKGFYCQFSDPSDPDADSLNAQMFHFVGSVRTGRAFTDVLSWNAVLLIDFEQNYGDAWWQLGSGGCRAGSITFKCNGFSTPTTCNTQLMETSPPPVTTDSWTTAGGAFQNEYRMEATRSTETSMADTVMYQLFEVSIDSRFTKPDPNDPRGDHECSGCQRAACLVLAGVQIRRASGVDNFTVPEITAYITWQGGGGAGCYAVPVRRGTWGQIKTQYR